MLADHGIEHQRDVADGPSHRPLDRERVEWSFPRAAGDPARAGTQADDGAEARRRAQAAAEIGAGSSQTCPAASAAAEPPDEPPA